MGVTRITTNMIMRNYQNNLTSTLGGLESTRRQVETGSRIEYSYEDPAAATKATLIQRNASRNADYLNNVSNAQKWQDTQEAAVLTLSGDATRVAKEFSVEAVTGTTDYEGREAFARALREYQDSMVATLNAKYGDTFVFAGNDGTNAPFALDENRWLTFRGIPVSSRSKEDKPYQEQLGEIVKNEHSYIDLGFGMKFDENGQVVESTAFDTCLPGIEFMGYGESTIKVKQFDGTDKEYEVKNNLIDLMGQMADVLVRTKDNFTDTDYKDYAVLWNKFTEGSNDLRDYLVTMGTKSQLLESTKERLTDQKLSYTEQLKDAIGIEPAEAIMNYSWANYAYNSALKIGSSLITPSLLDFMS